MKYLVTYRGEFEQSIEAKSEEDAIQSFGRQEDIMTGCASPIRLSRAPQWLWPDLFEVEVQES